MDYLDKRRINSNTSDIFIHFPAFGRIYLYIGALVVNTFILLSTSPSISADFGVTYEIISIIVIISIAILFNRSTGRLTISPYLNNNKNILIISVMQILHCSLLIVLFNTFVFGIFTNPIPTSTWGDLRLVFGVFSISLPIPEWRLARLVMVLFVLITIETHLLFRVHLDISRRAKIRNQLGILRTQINNFREHHCSGPGYKPKVEEIVQTAEETFHELDNGDDLVIGEDALQSTFQQWFEEFRALPDPMKRQVICRDGEGNDQLGEYTQETSERLAVVKSYLHELR